ncbi:MAG: aspartate kinase [Acidobacteriia bacterium]|nr:aspartate kinase [Terriglobia bacterium]
MKFGGTSVGNADAIRHVARIVHAAQADWPQVVVVVSAMGGVTDMLLKGAHTAAEGDGETFRVLAGELRGKHYDTLNNLAKDLSSPVRWDEVRVWIASLVDEFETLCHAVYVLGEASARALDAISSLGERMSIQLVAPYLREAGIPAEPIEATELIVTDKNFQSANPISELTRSRTQARLFPLLENGIVPVVTGFIGATALGVVTTLGRGGSDFSAALLGVALDAREVWIWTDVDGVMTADPRIVAAAKTLPEITFREISELAYYGAKVLHPKTIRPVVERDIALWVKNTFNPSNPGTRVVSDDTAPHGTIRAVTAIRGQTMLNVEGRGMLGVPGVAARTFSAVARTHTSVSLITQASSEQSICFIVPSRAGPLVMDALNDEFRRELEQQNIDRIWAMENVVIITVVGAGMRHTPGIAGQIFSSLGKDRINVVAIAQGSSECSVSMIVDAPDAEKAVREIHKLIEMREG